MAREIRNFDISFKDPNSTYKVGDVITGSVTLELSSPLKTTGIRLNLHGIAQVTWDKKNKENIDLLLDDNSILLQRDNSQGPLAAGRYNYPFTTRLPPYLPATFEGQWGRVKYFAKAVVLKTPSGDIPANKTFIVNSTLDLNTDDEAKNPAENAKETMAGQMCCKSGPISGKIALEKIGYVSGQNIPFNVEVENKSKSKLKNVTVQLIQEVDYKSGSKSKVMSTEIKGLLKGDVDPGETITWEDEVKNIPSIPPSRLATGCKLIDVKYILKLSGAPAGGGNKLDVPVEVIIGTIPLRKTESGTPMLTVKAAARRLSNATEAQQSRDKAKEAKELFCQQSQQPPEGYTVVTTSGDPSDGKHVTRTEKVETTTSPDGTVTTNRQVRTRTEVVTMHVTEH